MSVGENIRFYRMSKKWTQRELSQRSKVAVEQLNRYEMGRVVPRVVAIVRLTRALGVPLSDLLVD